LVPPDKDDVAAKNEQWFELGNPQFDFQSRDVNARAGAN
jgi:hypothetical protein